MLGYRRKSFKIAHALLSDLRANPGKLTVLSSLQHLLIDEIISAEQKIREVKKKLDPIHRVGFGAVEIKRDVYLTKSR